jgi:NAD(P)-dependent dehydrogenase (short-subunit alcohol dehydrogenase family)
MSFQSVWGFDPDEVIRSQKLDRREPNADESVHDDAYQLPPGMPLDARGTFFTVQKALPLLRDGASIILVSSCVQTKGIPQYSTYSATKAAIRSFARSWAAELKYRNIRVNTLSPGATDTPIIDGQFKTKAEAEEAKKQFTTMIPLGRLGDPSELASAALFLASSDSSYVTGIDLVVDGGWTQI